MNSRRIPVAATAALIFFSVIALPAGTAIVEHTFVVSQVTMTHLCKDTLVTVVNGQLPGPAIEVTEGDSIAVHVVNKSPFNLTIHWHGVRQLLNCWADGVPMITQRPILPNQNFTYRFDVAEQEGTLWWHAHVPCLRATIHGILVIRPRHGAISYPFPKPHKEIPVIIGEWWDLEDLGQIDRHLRHYVADDYFKASTINGMLGDLYNCSGITEEGFKLDVEPGETYLLRLLNAALFSEYYLKIAGHKFTVVAADANYVSPYTTDIIAIAPGQTFDALVIADASPGRYYMVAMPIQAPKPDYQSPVFYTRGIVQYYSNGAGGNQSGDVPMSPEMPDNHNHMLSFNFHGNLTSLHHPRHLKVVPKRTDERLFITLGLGSVCRQGQSCKRGTNGEEDKIVATMNNMSYELPTVSIPLLEAHYQNPSNIDWLQELPDVPPRVFNFTDNSLIPTGPKEEKLEPTSKAALARRFRYGAVVDVVFQSTSMLQSESNPMHLHGYDTFVLAQGHGNYDMERDVARYNLVNPPLVNTVHVPRLGWVAVRFVADNPGVWYMHCHYEFHLSMGMVALFIVEDGPTANTSLPSPPVDFLTYGNDNNLIPYEYYL